MKIINNRFLLLFVFLIPGFSNAQLEQSRKKYFNIDSKFIAVQGFDVVSYFISDRPKKGKQEFVYNYKAINYFFSSTSNLEIFKKNPEKWEPAYGGWCAYAMGNSGEKVEINPETFKIIDNKLYLFYNAYFTNTLLKWNNDEKNLKNKADKNWYNIESKKND